MLDFKALQTEYFRLKKEILEEERAIHKKKDMCSGLHLVLRSQGLDPDKDASENLEEETPAQTANGSSVLQFVRSHLPNLREAFGIEEVFPIIKAQLPAIEKKDISYALWVLAKQGAIKNVVKGKRGTPAKYTLNSV